LSVIGRESAMLVPAVSAEELRSFSLDNVSGFLLSLMDGSTSIESILDLSGLPRLLALRHLRSLLERGIVVVASGRRPR
jgi:predicted transcriptional regulator